jgi:hypothetical protein
MDNQIGNQTDGLFGLQLDELHPGADILDVGGVDAYLPVVADTRDHGGLEPELNDRIGEIIDQFTVTCQKNLPPHVVDAGDGRRWKPGSAGFEDGKCFLDEGVDIPWLLVGNQPVQCAIDIPQGILMMDGQSGDVHGLKQEDDFPLVADVAFASGIEQLPRDFTIRLGDGMVVIQFKQSLEHT